MSLRCLWQRGTEFPLVGTVPKDLYTSSCEVSVWLVDALPPSRSASRLRNARRYWRGNGQRPSLRGVLGGAGLFYLSPMGYRFPTLLPRSGSAVALSTNGCSGFWRRAWRDWPTSLAAAIIVCRASLPWRSSTRSARDAPQQTRWSMVEGNKFRAGFPCRP